MVRVSLENASMCRWEAWSVYSNSPQPVKDLTHQFFQSMDVNCDGGVTWAEIQQFFGIGASNMFIQPPFTRQLQHWLFMELDQDRDGSLNFSEFITFFHCLFLRARCDQCHRDLLGDDYITCVDCFAYAGSQSDYPTFDVCSTCNSTYGVTHYHSRSRFNKFKVVIFSEMLKAASMPHNGMATGTNFMAHSGSTVGTNFMAHGGMPHTGSAVGTNFMAPGGMPPSGGGNSGFNLMPHNGGTNFMTHSGSTNGSNFMAPGGGTSNLEIEPRRERYRQARQTLQAIANLVTIGGGCTIM